MKKADPTYFTWAPDHPDEAKYVEVDRRVKLVSSEPACLRALARALTEAECGFTDPHEVYDCDTCQAKQWVAEFVRSIATQNEHPREAKEPMSHEKHRALWDAMASTIEAYPEDGAKVGSRIRDLMHRRCRDNNNQGSDAICGQCQLLTVLGGACMHASLIGVSRELAEAASTVPPSHPVADDLQKAADSSMELADDLARASLSRLPSERLADALLGPRPGERYALDRS